MKNWNIFFLTVVMALSMFSCSKKDETSHIWEYKIIEIWGIDRGNFMSNAIPVPEDQLNKLGKEGWELVDVYTRIHTVHPNFGNDKYVTGLQPNTRTEGVFFVLKRQKNDVKNGKSSGQKP